MSGSRVVRIFPNRESCLRLASALLKEWHEDWIAGSRYLKMGALEVSGGDPTSESERELGEAA